MASSSGVAVSALGFAIARQEEHPTSTRASRDRSSLRRSDSAPLFDMTSTATCTVQPVDTYALPNSFSFSSSLPAGFSLSARQSLRSASSRDPTPGHARPASAGNKRSLKRSLYSRDGGETMASESEKAGEDTSDTSAWTSNVTQSTWLKRLSTFSSVDSSLPSSPRPASAAVSQSNNSATFSHVGSLTPMFPHDSPLPVPPNKLVKRTSSVRSTRSNSRLPLPTLRRPATSHQRDATIQQHRGRLSISASRPVSMANLPDDSIDVKWRNFFTPKIAAERTGGSWRRHSTSIPNPVKRICPDRRYRPVLLSAAEPVLPSKIEIDTENQAGVDTPYEFTPQTSPAGAQSGRRWFSSPLPSRRSLVSPAVSHTSSLAHSRVGALQHVASRSPSMQSPGPDAASQQGLPLSSSPSLSVRRSISPNDFLSTNPPAVKLTPNSTRLPQGKYRRKGLRSASGPPLSMGTRQSVPSNDIERPSKRRDVGIQQHRPASAKVRDRTSRLSNTPLQEVPLNLSSPAPRTTSFEAFASHSHLPKKEHETESDLPFLDAGVAPSPTSHSEASRPSRLSANLSEIASTFAGSDTETRYRDDDALDSPTGTFYDSVRTRATSTSSAVKGPALEKIFDEPITDTDTAFVTSEHVFSKPLFVKDTFDRLRHSVIEEEESISTPVRSTHSGSAKSSPEVFRFRGSPNHQDFPSSPPDLPSVFTQMPTNPGEDNESFWSFDDGKEEAQTQSPVKNRFPHLSITADRLSPYPKSHGSSSLTTTPSRAGIMAVSDRDARSNIFDWSEQQILDKSPGNHSPPRPKTVHGKKDAENRGSRSAGRRAPSGVHVRSQSVPSAPESDGKRSQVVTNKFGTWGVGSKGVTEDWNEDFDFEEPPPLPVSTITLPEDKRLDSAFGMHVPKTIREQQNNVLANIGLLRDWGLLIEELKELKSRAASLELSDGKNVDMWHEADAMIDLADHESHDRTLAPRQSPPSSPTFDYGAFDEPLPTDLPPLPSRLSIADENVFDSPLPSPVRKAQLTQEVSASPRRPRKDSEAVAKSVIEALQQKRNVSDPTPGGTVEQPAKKVPFDTATLRRIVPYVQELRDQVKRSIREAEGLYISPQHREAPNQDPSFSRIFQNPPESPSTRLRRRRSTAATDHHLLSIDSSSSGSPPDDLTSRMKLMTVV